MPSICKREIPPVLDIIASGTSASPFWSSTSFRSNTIFPSIFPAAHAETRSLMGIPASTSATEAAVMPAHLVPPSDCRISMKTSIPARGYNSVNIEGSKATRVTLESSLSRLEGAGRFLSVVEKGAIWYLHLKNALSGRAKCLGWTSRGP